jgi:NAD+ kinase
VSARVIVVAKRSQYTRFVEEERDPRARLLLAKRDPSVSKWLESHEQHTRTFETVLEALDRLGAKALVIRRAHAAFDTSDAALVVSVGGDGTLLAASHNVGGVPILGVNSAPKHSVGFFCAARRSNVLSLLRRSLEGSLESVELMRMRVTVNGRVRSTRVLNEALYSHASPAATSHYLLRYRAIREQQRSSGFWIGPAAGSTAAQRSAGGRVLPLRSKQLQLVVREPYQAFGQRYRLLRRLVRSGEKLVVVSKMQDSSLFLDGPYTRVSVQLGDVVAFNASSEPLLVLGLRERAES